jgi:hypothetical protein
MDNGRMTIVLRMNRDDSSGLSSYIVPHIRGDADTINATYIQTT